MYVEGGGQMNQQVVGD